MLFPCSPSKIKCEWFHCKDFVDQYNAVYGKSYSRSKCLDVEAKGAEGPDTPEPELLLEALGELPIALERKSVVWPRNYLSEHSRQHEFFERIADLLSSEFSDSLYQLTVRKESLVGKSKREVKNIANQIGKAVLKNPLKAKSERGIGSQQPIPWGFGPPSLLYEEDETIPDAGVGIVVIGADDWADLTQLSSKRNAAKAGYSKEFDRLAEDTEKKFAKYTHCQKILLVQFYGDSSSGLVNDDVIGIIQSAQLPELIDQVWLAQPEWVSEGEYEIVWERVR